MNIISELPSLENKKILFLAETHYQFINCINIASHIKNAKCDLYINELYPDAGEYAERLRNSRVFDEVKTYNVRYGKIRKALNFLFIKRLVQKYFNGFKYDVVFFASRDYLTRCVLTYCKYIMLTVALISYDEGLGTYIPRMEDYTNSFEKRIIKLLYHDEANLITDKILYKPEAYIGKASSIHLYTMPKPDKNVIDVLNNIYSYDKSMDFESKYIYFDNYYDEKDTQKNEILDCLISKTDGKLIIKKHPQTPDGAYKMGNVYQYPGLPYEIIAANDQDIENKTLITIMSTAVWSPSLVFEKYPKIVLLYPLYDNGEVNDAKKIIEKIISLYKKDRIKIIRSLDELKALEFDSSKERMQNA